MSLVTFIEPFGNTVDIDVADGWSLMEAATTQGVSGIEAACGGFCSCATCHCYVEGPAAALLPPPAADEIAMLGSTAAKRKSNSRLSCQIKMRPEFSGLVVRLPEKQS